MVGVRAGAGAGAAADALRSPSRTRPTVSLGVRLSASTKSGPVVRRWSSWPGTTHLPGVPARVSVGIPGPEPRVLVEDLDRPVGVDLAETHVVGFPERVARLDAI